MAICEFPGVCLYSCMHMHTGIVWQDCPQKEGYEYYTLYSCRYAHVGWAICTIVDHLMYTVQYDLSWSMDFSSGFFLPYGFTLVYHIPMDIYGFGYRLVVRTSK